MKKNSDPRSTKSAIIARFSNCLALIPCGIRLAYSIKTDCVLMKMKTGSFWINTAGDDDLVMLYKVVKAVKKQLRGPANKKTVKRGSIQIGGLTIELKETQPTLDFISTLIQSVSQRNR
jgi:hypothetical protein